MTQQQHAIERHHRRERVQSIEAAREIDYQQIHAPELRLRQHSAQRVAIAQFRGTRRRRCDRLATVSVGLIVVLHKADWRRLAAWKLIARNYAQAMRSRGRLDSFDHWIAPLRFHPEHRRDAGRIEVRIDDRDLAALHRPRRRDIHSEHALADSAARARKRNGRADAGKIGANTLANAG